MRGRKPVIIARECGITSEKLQNMAKGGSASNRFIIFAAPEVAIQNLPDSLALIPLTQIFVENLLPIAYVEQK